MESVRQRRAFWYAVALLVASAVGVGFYGIPYTFAQAGILPGVLIFFLVTIAILLTNLLYGEVVLRTHERHQFVGYVRKYLGPLAHRVNLLNFFVMIYGATIATLILNGQFLSEILSLLGWQISPVMGSIVTFALILMLVYSGLRMVSHIDIAVMGAVSIVIGIIIIHGFSKINFQNFSLTSGSAWFLPFGVILYAMNGMQGIPLVREMLVGHERSYKKAIMYGTLIPGVLFLVFALVVVGITGGGTTAEGIKGLALYTGKWVIILGSFLGYVTSSTIFMSIASSFCRSLYEDFHLRRKTDFIILLLPPLLLFFFGVRNFTGILSLVGGVAVSIDLILLMMIYARAKERGNRIPEYAMRVPNAVLYVLMGIFLLAAIYTVVS